jgi:DNA-binding NarL/FixJ family response regulator
VSLSASENACWTQIFSGCFAASAVVSALRAGALVRLRIKGVPNQVLIEAISIVAKGKRFIDPQLTDSMLRSLLNDEPLGRRSRLAPENARCCFVWRGVLRTTKQALNWV